MENSLQHISLQNLQLDSGNILDINLSYQLFGKDLFTAPIILVNHALTGNSNVAGKTGWWKTLIGDGKVINTEKFTVVCFNIPGNGFDGYLHEFPKNCSAKDIALIFLQGIKHLGIKKLHTLIGGSVGGSIGWEMLSIHPELAERFIPIACDFRTSDWLRSQCLVQDFLLQQKVQPVQKARIHAMLCYRTPQSLNHRFNNEFDVGKEVFKSQDWLNFHGQQLNERFSLSAYQMMNHILMNINADENKLENIKANIEMIAVDSDLFFPAFEMKRCCENLSQKKKNVRYHELISIHGHDAFLMEYEQLGKILSKILKKK